MHSRDIEVPIAAESIETFAEGSLFPLRFTPYEYYYLCEDRPDYPSAFDIRLEGQGPFDRNAFERAFAIAHQRHPLLSARIERDRDGWPVWVPGQADPICWQRPTAAEHVPPSGLTATPRLQTFVECADGRTALGFLFNHVAVDGMGAFQFISDLMVAYGHFVSNDPGPPKLKNVNPQLLRQRDSYSLLKRSMRVIDWLRLPRAALPILVRRAAMVNAGAREPKNAARPSSTDGFLVHTLSEEQTASLGRAARHLSTRLHNLLLRDYFLTLAAWNRGTREERLPLRILVPSNLRRREHYQMPAANAFGFTFLTRHLRQCQDPAKLLASIRDEMATIKRLRWAQYHEAALRAFCTFPSLLHRSLKRKWTFATAVFTNLNAGFDHLPLPWRDGRRVAGKLFLENGYGAGPLRPGTRVSLAVHTYAGRLSVALCADQIIFTPEEQRAMLQDYLGRLDITMRDRV